MATATDVKFFRPRIAGPELKIEDAVARNIDSLFFNESAYWTAGSLPIGSGRPDLVIASFEPEVFALADVDLSTAQILAYLRAARGVGVDTISQRLHTPKEFIVKSLDGLIRVEAINKRNNLYHLQSTWKNILPEIISIEAKVSNWRNAVAQAGRNKIFAHRSYIAVPWRIASKIKTEDIFQRLGIGILGVTEDEEVSEVLSAKRRRPILWMYYYHLALILAKHAKGNHDAVYRSN